MSARKKGRILPPPQAPMEVAREFVTEGWKHSTGTLTLRHWRDGWWVWCDSHWKEVSVRFIRSQAYAFTDRAMYAGDKGPAPWDPTRHKIGNLLDALAAICHLPDSLTQPAWINERETGVIVACANGLLDVEKRRLLKHDPNYFNQTAVPFPYNPRAAKPERWFRFLQDLWDDDDEQIAVLQEWFGYVISGRTDLHKILLMVGPTRGGKGAIARVLRELIGKEFVAGPTLSSLKGEFGLAPLIGKPLATVSDARLGATNSNVVVERLLSVSGEDAITVNIKYREQWTGKLPTRFMVLSNELPQFGDASAAIAGRFLTLLLSRSWLGRENHELEPALHEELTGILNWGIAGLKRLEKQGQFTRSRASERAFVQLQELASPVHAFVNEHCVLDPQARVAVDDLWTAWESWAATNGQRPGSKQHFGKNLRAAFPQIDDQRVRRPSSGRQRITSSVSELGDRRVGQASCESFVRTGGSCVGPRTGPHTVRASDRVAPQEMLGWSAWSG